MLILRTFELADPPGLSAVFGGYDYKYMWTLE